MNVIYFSRPEQRSNNLLHPPEQLRVKTKIALAGICTSNTSAAMAGDCAADHRVELKTIRSNPDLSAAFSPLPPFISARASKCFDSRPSIMADSLSCDKKCNFLNTENGNLVWRIEILQKIWVFISMCCVQAARLFISVRRRHKETSQRNLSAAQSQRLARGPARQHVLNLYQRVWCYYLLSLFICFSL